jgi:predicted PurR-regulated permease PerM
MWTSSPASTQRTLLVMLLASIALVVAVLRPLAVALFLAAVVGAGLFPIHRRLTRLFRGRDRAAALLLIFVVLVLVLAPLVSLSAFVVKEGAEALRYVSTTVRSQGVEGLIARLPHATETLVREILGRFPEESSADLSATVQRQVTSQGGSAAAAVGAAVAATGSLLFQGAMMLIALFFFLTQKDKIIDWIDDASPLRKGQTHELLAEFRKVTVSVLRSTVLTALVQALAALAGYYLARVPHPIFFAAVTFFVAMVPAIGAASVCIAAAGLLLVTGHAVAAAFLAGWGILVVGLSDNVVKPLLIRGGVEMHGAIVFFSLLGGLAAFGAIGLLLGPLAVALFIALLRIYRRDYGEDRPTATKALPIAQEPPPRGDVIDQQA